MMVEGGRTYMKEVTGEVEEREESLGKSVLWLWQVEAAPLCKIVLSSVFGQIENWKGTSSHIVQPCSIYRYEILIVDILTLLKIFDIDKVIFENIDTNKAIRENIDIDKDIPENIDIDKDNPVNIDIDKGIIENIKDFW